MQIIKYDDKYLENVKDLLAEIEEYFKSIGCEYVIVDVLAYNEIGKTFYNKKNYHTRMETIIKKI